MMSKKPGKLFNLPNVIVLIFIAFSLFSSLTPYFKLDLLISEKIQSINSGFFSGVMWFVTSIGNQPLMVYIVSTTCLILYALRYRVESIVLVLTSAGSTLSGALIKALVDRPRPSANLVRVSVWLSDKSYPSGHVLIFTVFFGFLLYLLFKRVNRNLTVIVPMIIFILLIATIGISRIYLGAHWPSDVVGGYLLGVIWLILAIRLYNSYHGKR